MKLSDLNPAAYNPRKNLQPEDEEYRLLAKGIQEFGLVEPLVMNKRSGNLVSGHQRLKVMLDLGYTEAEVSVVDLPEGKEKQLNIALNKLSGDWDMPKLKDLLEELDTGADDIEFTGFTEADLEQLMSQFFVEPKDENEPGADQTLPSTFIYRPSLNKHRGIRYISIRRWPSNKKDAAKESFKAIKRELNSDVLWAIAGEIVACIVDIFHTAAGFYVTNPPPGNNSGKHFATALAKVTADRLGVPYHAVFERLDNKEEDRPYHKYGGIGLKGDPPAGFCILIDDVATTGQTLEQCIRLLQEHGIVFPVVWISGDMSGEVWSGEVLESPEASYGNLKPTKQQQLNTRGGDWAMFQLGGLACPVPKEYEAKLQQRVEDSGLDLVDVVVSLFD
jgi:hypothetical protein